MRNNQPVTNRERTFPASEQLISTTDLGGIITGANDSFVRISGFSAEELKGQPHNLVRHPDMPPAAFADLWQSLKQRKPWMGLVKNRSKNGDHYYVDAYVTPIIERDQIIGYQSVRVIPDRAVVDRAEQRYAEIRHNSVPFWRQFMSTHLPLKIKLLLLCGWAALPALVMQQWLVAVASIALVFVFGGWMVYPVVALAEKARTIFSDALTQDVYTGRGDEIGQLDVALRALQAQSRTILGRIGDASNQISHVAEQTREIVQHTTSSVESQQHELDQVATAMQEMSATVNEVANSAERTAGQSRDVMEKTANGERLVNQAMTDIESLSQVMRQAKEVIERLMRESDSIGSVVDVISSIASETNLLALNAAIEAARAGEQGRGFAVVADEVRKLASNTQQSTDEIQRIVQSIQAATAEAVTAMQQGQIRVDQSLTASRDVVGAFRGITDAVTQINDMNAQVATASEEQSAVSEEINRNIVGISDRAAETLQQARSTSAASDELQRATLNLQAIIRQFG
jgi:aerotaxis receptor